MDVFPSVLFVALVLLMLVVLSLALPVTFRFRLRFSPGGLRQEAWVRFPLVPWYVRIPLWRAGRKRESARKSGQESDSGDGGDGPAERARAFMGSARATLASFREVYPRIRGALKSVGPATTLEQFRLRARLGTGDAFETAMLVGSLISLSGVLLSVAARKGVRFGERPLVRIVPVFDRPFVSVDLRGSVSVVPWRGLRIASILVREIRKLRSSKRAFVSKAPGWNTKV